MKARTGAIANPTVTFPPMTASDATLFNAQFVQVLHKTAMKLSKQRRDLNKAVKDISLELAVHPECVTDALRQEWRGISSVRRGYSLI